MDWRANFQENLEIFKLPPLVTHSYQEQAGTCREGLRTHLGLQESCEEPKCRIKATACLAWTGVSEGSRIQSLFFADSEAGDEFRCHHLYWVHS